MSAGNMVPVLDIQEIYNVRGRAQINSFAVGAVAAESSTFTDMGNEAGTSAVYAMWSDVPIYWRHNTAASGSSASTTTGIYLPANSVVTLRIFYGDVINAIVPSGLAGTLHFIQINR